MLSLPGLALGAQDMATLMATYSSVGTIFSIVSLYASSTARPHWRLFEQDLTDRNRYTTRDEGSDQRKQIFMHPALELLYNPNPHWSRFTLMELGQMYLDLTGESYWVITYDQTGTVPIGLWPVRPDRMTPVPDPTTYLAGWVYTSPNGREKIPLHCGEVIFVKYPNPMDAYRGLGPVQSILIDIEAAKYSAEWNRNFFINSAEPGGVIEVDHEVEDEEFRDLMNRWREGHRGVSRTARVAVLEVGQKWVPNERTVKDMDFVNLRNTSRDIFREAFRMHKVMIGVSDDVNRANAQTGEEVFSSWGVVPRLDRWQDALQRQLLPKFGAVSNGLELDYVTPIPPNREQDNEELTSKSQAALVLRQAGYAPEDVLRAVGLPDMGTAPPPAPAPAGPAPDAAQHAEAQGQGVDDRVAAILARAISILDARGELDMRRLAAPLNELTTGAGR